MLNIRGAELIHRGLRSINKLEEEDRRNYDVRLTVERVKAITAGNNVFNPKSLDRLLSGVLGSVDRIIRAIYHNTPGL